MPFFSDYGYYHGSAPFSSQYYSQLLPYPGSNSGRTFTRVQPRNYNSIAVEQTLRAIRRGPGAITARHYSRPVHLNVSEIDVTSPRQPKQSSTTAETAVSNENSGSDIHRGRTVVRLHTKNKRSEQLPVTEEGNESKEVVVTNTLPELVTACVAPVLEEGLAKKGTIKRHTSAGIKVPVNDDRRPSVTDEILREQEALFDTMIMEEMEGQRGRRKSYPVDCITVDNKKQQKIKETRKKSAAAVMNVSFSEQEKPVKKTNWKLNYDVIIEESGTEPVSYTFKLNKTKKEKSDPVGVSCNENGKTDVSHKVVLKSHDEKNNNKKHDQTIVKNCANQNNNNNSDDVCMMSVKKTKVVKKKIVVKKKVIKKKEGQEQPDKQQTSSPLKSKKKVSKTEASTLATATAAVITPFVRASFGKTFISPSQVSSTKSKFEKPKPKIKQETLAPSTPRPTDQGTTSSSNEKLPNYSSEDEESSSAEDSSSVSSGSGSSSGSSYFDSDDYGDKRIACSNSSFDSGLPPSPVPAPDPIGRK